MRVQTRGFDYWTGDELFAQRQSLTIAGIFDPIPSSPYAAAPMALRSSAIPGPIEVVIVALLMY